MMNSRLPAKGKAFPFLFMSNVFSELRNMQQKDTQFALLKGH